MTPVDRRHRRWTGHRAAVTGVLVMVVGMSVVAACAGRDGRADGLAATLEQYREDEVAHTLAVQMTNAGKEAIRVVELRLEWAGLSDVAAVPVDVQVSPGQIVDLEIPYGRAVCEDPPHPDDPPPPGPAFAVGVGRRPDGTQMSLRVPVTDTRGVLGRIYPPGCARATVEHAATVEFGPTWTPVEVDGAPASRGTIVLERQHGTDAVAVAELGGSVLLTMSPEASRSGASDGAASDGAASGGAASDGAGSASLGSGPVGSGPVGSGPVGSGPVGSGPASSSPVGSGGVLVRLAPGEQRAELPIVLTSSGNCAPHALAESKHTFLLPVTVVVGELAPIVMDLSPEPKSRPQILEMINRSCGVA